MKTLVYEISGLMLVGSSFYFFYRCVSFLTANDYISAVVSMLIGFVVIRAGVELSKLGLLSEHEERSR